MAQFFVQTPITDRRKKEIIIIIIRVVGMAARPQIQSGKHVDSCFATKTQPNCDNSNYHQRFMLNWYCKD